MDGFDTIIGIVQKAEQIENEKNGLALTEDEAQTLKAAAFLRAIAPYVWGTDDVPSKSDSDAQ